MRITLLTLFLVIIFDLSYGQSTIRGLDELESEDIVQITRDSHDSWIEWSNDDKSIFFISPESGNNNLYQIKLDEIELTEVRPNIYAATYLIDSLPNSPINQLTFEDKVIVESPIAIPKTNTVAFMTYKCDPYPCENFSIRTLDLDSEEAKTIMEENSTIYFYDFIDDNRMIYVTDNADSTIMELKLSTGEKKPFASLGFSISGLNIGEKEILVGSENGIYSVDITSKESELIYSGNLSGSRISKIGDILIGILPGPASGMINIKTNEEVKFVDSYDYQPSLSNTQDYVAIISEGAMGILIKKLDL